MITVSATETKNQFGRVLQQAAKEPVTIEKSGYPVAVLVSHDTFERYQIFEDYYWGERAKKARENGEYIGSEALVEEFQKRLEE
jgi:prevent-host-death family protein